MDGLDEAAVAEAMHDAVRGTHGVASRSIAPDLAETLLGALDGIPFEPLDPKPGGGLVTQFGMKLEVPRSDAYGAYWELARAVGRLGADLPGEDRWFDPNSILVQRYGPTNVGVSPHRDSARFHGLIVIATIEGEATFSLHDDRDGPPAQSFVVGAGDVCVLPAAGLSRPQLSLPFHAVSGALGRHRTSVTFRRHVG